MSSCKIIIGHDDSYNYYDDFINNEIYAEEKEEVNALVDVAFNDNIEKTKKVSYNKTIDVQFGRYKKFGSNLDGCLTINLKASYGWRDWLINFLCFGIKYHFGYKHEIHKYAAQFTNDLIQQMKHDEKSPVIITGRSKGAGEALMICDAIYQVVKVFGVHRVIVGAFAPPKCMSKSVGRDRAESIGMANIYTFIHRSDIVPKVLPWFSHVPCYMIKFGEKGERPFKTHIKVTTDRSVYDFL